ncbi:hypothetical protein EJD97_020492 [Solanum chilense]|uniref:Uncharacterized protein n=1 Tax=Solanum chilense TaxID=4083 RepID=A0A6N2AX10_SOLCI|nr:hypothetical protein EJD97_020492 [Solanum chilense]
MTPLFNPLLVKKLLTLDSKMNRVDGVGISCVIVGSCKEGDLYDEGISLLPSPSTYLPIVMCMRP